MIRDTASAAFETGDFSEVNTSGTDITVTSSSPIAGLYSALFTITDTSVRTITLALHGATRGEMHAQFDITSLTMTNGDIFTLMYTAASASVAAVQITQTAGQKQLRAQYRNGGANTFTSFVNVPGNTFTLHIYFIVSATVGHVRVDANTTNLVDVSGLNNADGGYTANRIGTTGLDAGTGGSFKVDNAYNGIMAFVPWLGMFQKGRAANDLSAKFFSSIRTEFWSGGWQDINADILSKPDPSAEWGIKGDKITQRVAGAGKQQFALNNSVQNSAGLAGYYSPGHINCRPGFHEGAPIRWVFVYGGTEYVMGKGEIGSIKPIPGRYNERNTQVIAFDFMKRVGEYDTTYTLPVLTDATSDQAYAAILDALAVQPDERSLTTGVDAFDYLFVAALGERPGALGEIARVAGSGLEYVFVAQDGTFKNQTRQDRIVEMYVSAWLNEHMTDMEPPVTSEDNIIDSATAQVYPYELGAAAETVYELDTPFVVGPGETRTFIAPYTDPDALGKRVAVTELDTSLVAGTNYLFGVVGNGTDNSLNANLTASVAADADGIAGATAALVTVTNSGSISGYVNMFVLTGTIYRTNNPQQFTQTADGRTGNRNLRMDLPYVSNFNLGRAFAQYAALREGESYPRVSAVTFNANRNHESMLAALTADVGDKVRVTEPQSGIDGLYFINKKRWELRAGKLMWVTWELERAEDRTDVFILDESLLDTGRLGI